MPINETTNVQTSAIYEALDEVKQKGEMLRNAGTILIDQTIVNLQRKKKPTNVKIDSQELKERKIINKTIDAEIKQLKSLKNEAKKRSIESGSDAHAFAGKVLSQVLLSMGTSRSDPKNLMTQIRQVDDLAERIGKDYREISTHIQSIANEHIAWAHMEQKAVGKVPSKSSKVFSAIVEKLKDLTVKCQKATQKVLTQATSSLDSLLQKESQEIKKAVAEREKVVVKNGKIVSPIMEQISKVKNNLDSQKMNIENFIRSEREDIERSREELPILSDPDLESLHNDLLYGSKEVKLRALDKRSEGIIDIVESLEEQLTQAEAAKKQLETVDVIRSDPDKEFARKPVREEEGLKAISVKEYNHLKKVSQSAASLAAQIEKHTNYLRNIIDLHNDILNDISDPDTSYVLNDGFAPARILAERELGLNHFVQYLDLVNSEKFAAPPRLDKDSEVQAWIKQRQNVLDQTKDILSIMNPFMSEEKAKKAEARKGLQDFHNQL